jgi:hypothetical protein
MPGHAPNKCLAGARACAADVLQCARFSVAVFLRDEHSARIHDNPVLVDPEHFHFAKEHRFINDTACGDAERGRVRFRTGRDLSHDDFLAIDRDGMSRVRATTSHKPRRVRGVGQEGHNLAFAF